MPPGSPGPGCDATIAARSAMALAAMNTCKLGMTTPHSGASLPRRSIPLVFELCKSPGHRRRASRQAALNEWLADSAAYDGILNKWPRDSTVIDSIARTIPTDSLQKLYRAAKTAPHPFPIFQAIDCERLFLRKRYGLTPMTWAAQRAESASWTPAEESAAVGRLPERMVLEDDACNGALRTGLSRVGETDLLLRPDTRPLLWPRP